jgi:hypothetical protein
MLYGQCGEMRIEGQVGGCSKGIRSSLKMTSADVAVQLLKRAAVGANRRSMRSFQVIFSIKAKVLLLLSTQIPYRR